MAENEEERRYWRKRIDDRFDKLDTRLDGVTGRFEEWRIEMTERLGHLQTKIAVIVAVAVLLGSIGQFILSYFLRTAWKPF